MVFTHYAFLHTQKITDRQQEKTDRLDKGDQDDDKDDDDDDDEINI